MGIGNVAEVQFTWTTGVIPQTTFASGETRTITGTGNHDFNGQAIVNAGTFTWTGGNLRASGGATFTIASGGVLDDSSTGTGGTDVTVS
jgi:hypothetical protein